MALLMVLGSGVALALVPALLSVELEVQGTRTLSPQASRYETVQGMLRAPSLARYARYVEGNSPPTYTGGALMEGEIMVSGDIRLLGSPVTFTRLVSTGGIISNRNYGQFNFGFRERQLHLPTLSAVHVNAWDNHQYDPSRFGTIFQSIAGNGGISPFGGDSRPGNPGWSRLNSTAACRQAGPCDILFANCYDTLSSDRRSPVVAAGSAVALDLSQPTLSGDSLIVWVSSVVFDAGGEGGDYFTLGAPARPGRR